MPAVPTTANPVPEPAARYGYRVGVINLLVPERVPSEVLTQATIFPLPVAPAWIRGVTNVRGNIVPVVDLHHLFTPDTRAGSGTVLLLDQGEWMVGVLVDDLPRPVRPRAAARVAAEVPADLLRWLAHAGQDGGADWFEFDHRGALAQRAQTASGGG